MIKNVPTDEIIISQTRNWAESVIVGLNFCPFAKREVQRNSINYSVVRSAELQHALGAVIAECQRLDDHTEIETTLLIYANSFARFEDYLELLELANTLLSAQGYEGIYQLASFHPHYCFADSSEDAVENYTNRSPYPMLHLIREDSIAMALKNYPQAEDIPQRNIELARKKGSAVMQAMLDACLDLNK